MYSDKNANDNSTESNIIDVEYILKRKSLADIPSLTMAEIEYLKGKIFAVTPESLEAGISLLKTVTELLDTTPEQKKEIEEKLIQPINVAFHQLMSNDDFFTNIIMHLNSEKKLVGLPLEDVLKSKAYRRSIDEAIRKACIEKALKIDNIAGAIEILKSHLPSKYLIANNKLANEMTKDFLDKGPIELSVINPRKKNEVFTYNSLSYDTDGITIVGKHEFTAYDRSVHNAVCTLYEVGNECITPQMVYRTLNGMTNSEKVNPQAISDIMRSIDKSRFMRLKVDFTKEAKARNLNVQKAIIDSYLLAAESIIISTGGTEVVGYKILRSPVLYEYAQQTKQIISVPLKMLDTREVVNNTAENIPIKEYLIRRIEIMKHNLKRSEISNKITYDTIFLEVGMTDLTKQKAHKLRKTIKSFLVFWQNKDYIKGFEEYKDGKTIKGIEIYF